MTSLWRDRTSVQEFPALEDDGCFDYVVIGAGLTGLATAVLLTRSGARVAVVEARTVGACTTGNTTGKVSVLQGTQRSTIGRFHGTDVVDAYVQANSEAQQWITRFCDNSGVGFQREAAYSYAQTPSGTPGARAEYDACRAAGLDVAWEGDVAEVPFPVHGAVRLDDQVQLDAMELLQALVAEACANGARIYEHTRVQGVSSEKSDASGVVVHTRDARLRADAVVVATGTPILDRGGFFARLTPRRSHGLAFRPDAAVPRGMYVSVDAPTRSVRYAPDSHGDLLLIGGNGHDVGRERYPQTKVDELIAWARRYFGVGHPTHQWSAQDYAPADGLPYAGPLLPGNDRILVASGFNKWGLTNAVAAAHALVGRLLDEPRGWAHVLDTWNTRELAGLGSMTSANGKVALAMARGWVRAETHSARCSPAEGEGHVERRGIRPVGVCTVDGATVAVSAVCPHLYGILSWNDADRSWDCPLHGSRFAADGAVLEGPATSPLQRAE
jgi:glycine/D-amino acid oxidase-like deaminating enzyme/nitrite reductase/ring-hydroxylating ferredoxin subunit